MSIKEPQARVTPQEPHCRQCGHSELLCVSRPWGESRLWLAYCPACRNVQDQASIPESFLEGLPPLADRHDLH
ncbi:MAG: hypothetical protein HZB55_20960 [Deltaproteobacteria bacterium]|nr:hypothetical protein [Deltaproteobacteria bacterium]